MKVSMERGAVIKDRWAVPVGPPPLRMLQKALKRGLRGVRD